jgi:hypothetical protein
MEFKYNCNGTETEKPTKLRLIQIAWMFGLAWLCTSGISQPFIGAQTLIPFTFKNKLK